MRSSEAAGATGPAYPCEISRTEEADLYHLVGCGGPEPLSDE